MRPSLFIVTGFTAALFGCGSSPTPSIEPAPPTPAASANDDSQSSSAPVPGSNAPAAEADSGAPSIDAAPLAVSSFDVNVAGVAQQVSRMRAVYMPTQHRVGVVAHLRASNEVPEGDLIVFLSKTAAGDVHFPDAYVFFDKPMTGDRYAPHSSSVVSDVSIGAVGAPVSGKFTGELSSTKRDKLDFSFSFSVVRESDSEVL
jgi:hypothetical protein